MSQESWEDRLIPSESSIWLTEKALLWPAAGYDYHGQPRTDRYGEPLWSSEDTVRGEPTEINVRWEDSTSLNLSGNESRSAFDATVAVDREIEEGSILWRGKKDDWYGTGSSTSDPDRELMIVARKASGKDLKGRSTGRIVYLKRWKKTLPESV